MKLKKGSYYYLLGALTFFLSFLAALLSGIFQCSYAERKTLPNCLLSPFGSGAAGGVCAILSAFVLAAAGLALAGAVLFDGLKKNALLGALTGCAVFAGVFQTALAVLTLCGAFSTENAPATFYLRFLPQAAAIALLALALCNVRGTRLPSIFFFVMCAYASFIDFGYDRIVLRDAPIVEPDLTGYLGLFLLSCAYALFCVGTALCVGSSEYRTPGRRGLRADLPATTEKTGE